MKRNLISVLVLALVMANLILTAVLLISVFPQVQRTNALIDKVSAAIDLSMTGTGGTTVEGTGGGGSTAIPIEHLEEFKVNNGEEMVINLQGGSYARLRVVLEINKEDPDYEAYGTSAELTARDGTISSIINEVIQGKTLEEMQGNPSVVKEEILEALRQHFNGSHFIVSVAFPTAVYQ